MASFFFFLPCLYFLKIQVYKLPSCDLRIYLFITLSLALDAPQEIFVGVFSSDGDFRMRAINRSLQAPGSLSCCCGKRFPLRVNLDKYQQQRYEEARTDMDR